MNNVFDYGAQRNWDVAEEWRGTFIIVLASKTSWLKKKSNVDCCSNIHHFFVVLEFFY
jgi:hypothetical protein